MIRAISCELLCNYTLTSTFDLGHLETNSGKSRINFLKYFYVLQTLALWNFSLQWNQIAVSQLFSLFTDISNPHYLRILLNTIKNVVVIKV